ncbi:MAG: hypothetical protein JXR30_00345 [Alphaproteobacteria bacterium]|nr:hypothetical protein [Alphaproteobacteria bacterium]
MKKIILVLGVLGLGGCVDHTPQSAYGEREWVEEEPVSQNGSSDESQMPPSSEQRGIPITGDPLVDAQSEAEYSLMVHDKIKADAQSKTKPISYERALIRDPQMKTRFMRTWNNLEKGQNVPIEDPRVEFIRKQYEELLEHSKTCCLTGISAELDRASVEKDKTYAFLKDDYNFYRAGELCYFYSETDIEQIFGRSEDIQALIKRVQKNCLCLNHDRLKEKTTILNALLTHRNLDRQTLSYISYDEFGRKTRRHMIPDVQNVDRKLRCCSGNPNEKSQN